MTEQEWLQCSDCLDMLVCLYGHGQHIKNRKLRLFGCACIRRAWHLLEDERSKSAIMNAEAYADGQCDELFPTRAELESESASRHYEEDPLLPHRVNENAYALSLASHAVSLVMEDNHDLWSCVIEIPGSISAAIGHSSGNHSYGDEAEADQCDLLRDIFGNLFRPVTVDLAWRTATVVSLATAIYEDRAFDRLPILGDALEDAGCDNADILNHCRQPGEHARGCWETDLLLGKQ